MTRHLTSPDTPDTTAIQPAIGQLDDPQPEPDVVAVADQFAVELDASLRRHSRPAMACTIAGLVCFLLALLVFLLPGRSVPIPGDPRSLVEPHGGMCVMTVTNPGQLDLTSYSYLTDALQHCTDKITERADR